MTCSSCNGSASGRTYENFHAREFDLRAGATKVDPESLALAFAMKAAAARTLGIDFRVEFKKLDDTPFLMAQRKLELKSAYILAFSTLGYSYTERPHLDYVRSLLLDPNSSLEFSACALAPKNSIRAGKIIIITSPFSAVAVTLPTLHSVDSNDHLVYLPFDGLQGRDFYAFLSGKSFDVSELVIAAAYDWPKSGHPTFTWDSIDGNDVTFGVRISQT